MSSRNRTTRSILPDPEVTRVTRPNRLAPVHLRAMHLATVRQIEGGK